MSETRNAGEILISMIKSMTPEEQDRTLYLVQGAKIGEAIGAVNAEAKQSA